MLWRLVPHHFIVALFGGRRGGRFAFCLFATVLGRSRAVSPPREGGPVVSAQQHPFLFWSAFIKPRRTEGVTEGVGASRRPRGRCPRDGQAGQAEPRAPAARQLGPGPNFPSEVCVHLRRPTRLQTLASSHRAGPWECRVNCV